MGQCCNSTASNPELEVIDDNSQRPELNIKDDGNAVSPHPPPCICSQDESRVEHIAIENASQQNSGKNESILEPASSKENIEEAQ